MAARIQREDFDIGAELANFGRGAGAVCTFLGMVRDLSEGRQVTAMTLEHYPGMTERELARIEQEARDRWRLLDALIIHRYGRLESAERIVLVAVASAQRDDAFQACRFIIDRLKTRAPFWKAEETNAGRHWVEARAADDAAAGQWDIVEPPRKRQQAPIPESK